MNVSNERRIYYHQINNGLRSVTPLNYHMFVKVPIGSRIKEGGIIFLGGENHKDTREKVSRTFASLIDSLAKHHGTDFVVGFDIPQELDAQIAANSTKTREEIRRNIFPAITDYKVEVLHACARNKIPTTCFGWEWENELRTENPWRAGPRTMAAVWKKETANLRKQFDFWTKQNNKKAIVAVVDPWAASDKGIPFKFNTYREGQAGLFDERNIPLLSVKIGTNPLPGHEPWREACFDWVIRPE